LDLGFGDAASSLFFARAGAHVVAVDNSAVAVENLSNYCNRVGITNISPNCLSANEIATVAPVDHIFGSMILHHVEPFAEFAAILRATLRVGGKGFFFENNARNKVLIWFRRNVVGKLWIPKYGDDEESPLTPDEVDQLGDYFHVRVEYPELLFFRLASIYIFDRALEQPCSALDRFFFRFERIRRHSYRQYVFLS
jgi:2-polyprenyl-3-methyl-5-hydroxy-6-metoxy-1,4-benzoquinol methylase